MTSLVLKTTPTQFNIIIDKTTYELPIRIIYDSAFIRDSTPKELKILVKQFKYIRRKKFKLFVKSTIFRLCNQTLFSVYFQDNNMKKTQLPCYFIFPNNSKSKLQKICNSHISLVTSGYNELELLSLILSKN